MNSLVFVALSMMVAVAYSSECGTMCNGACNIAKTNCDGALVLGPLCGLAYAQCSAGCNAVCACADACESQCTPAHEECKTQAGDNIIFLLECSGQNDACIVTCEAQCAVQNAFNTITQVIGGGAPTRK